MEKLTFICLEIKEKNSCCSRPNQSSEELKISLTASSLCVCVCVFIYAPPVCGGLAGAGGLWRCCDFILLQRWSGGGRGGDSDAERLKAGVGGRARGCYRGGGTDAAVCTRT